MVEFTREIIWSRSFLCGEIFNYNSIYLIDMVIIRLSVFSLVGLVVFFFPKEFNYFIYAFKSIVIELPIVFCYYSFNVNGVCSVVVQYPSFLILVICVYFFLGQSDQSPLILLYFLFASKKKPTFFGFIDLYCFSLF